MPPPEVARITRWIQVRLSSAGFDRVFIVLDILTFFLDIPRIGGFPGGVLDERSSFSADRP